ncbi:D-glycero-beta-D-manno-heptose-7-phosphate kinase [Curvivirga sp.]|uniref:D-glycero-beta-D-manno-heptose-7-phosphate kinase n=1 Tax=Curvivirga sp. TaxID=2856848 RepID=UPI003B59924B
MEVTGQDISQYLERLKSARVLCVGDVMLDRFCEGAVARVSPEAPIPVLHVSREEAHLGGAGNVARNLSALSVSTNLVSVCGDDAPARELEHLLESHDGVSANLIKLEDRPTIIKTRFVAGGQQLLRADWEKIASISSEIEKNILTQVEQQISEVGALILSDYGKGVLGEDLIQAIIKKANEANVPVIVDPKGDDFSCYAGASVLTPNRQELAQASKMPVGSDEEVINACEYLMENCTISGVLATRSEQGMSLIYKDRKPHHLSARAMEVFDVAGAGDTVIATFAAGIAAGMTMEEAAWLSNVAAGIVVAKVGTAVAYPDEILSSAHSGFWQEGEDKVISLDTAVNRAQRWRQKGLKVGFTNGCFDLLHPGHISLIEQAAANCDRLILGLNSDSSVKRLKGETRPIQNEVSRATVLASLAKVAMVVIFSEETPIELIRAIKPDVLVKGADYTVETVVGATDVQSWGGEVVLANLVEGQSTTSTIAKMNN